MCGLDADCNAGMVMPVITIRNGMDSIPAEYRHPAFERITTYMRGRFREITMEDLVDMTVNSIVKAEAGNRKQ